MGYYFNIINLLLISKHEFLAILPHSQIILSSHHSSNILDNIIISLYTYILFLAVIYSQNCFALD